MNKEEYIKQCGGRTSKDLSADKILSYFLKGFGGIENRASASLIKRGRVYGFDIDRAKAIAMLRQAFDGDKVMEIHYIENEGVMTDDKPIGGGHFLMKLRKG